MIAGHPDISWEKGVTYFDSGQHNSDVVEAGKDKRSHGTTVSDVLNHSCNRRVWCYLYITYRTSNILHYILWSQPTVLLFDTIMSVKVPCLNYYRLLTTCCDLCNLSAGGPMKTTISGLNRSLHVCIY